MPDHSIERVVPTGHAFLIFELDNLPRHTYHNDTLKEKNKFTKAWISGMHRNYISISAHQNSEMLVVQFSPYGAYPFFHQPIHNFNDKVIPAKEIFGNEILNLRRQIFEEKNLKNNFITIEKWLRKIFDENKTPPPELIDLCKKIKNEPIINFQKTARQYPHTQKHLIEQCKKYMGLTPKYFHRILRFNEIFQTIKKEEKVAWSSIAYSCGFADQSHFIKEFKHFSGFNPQEFIKQDLHREEVNFFPLDRGG